MKFIRTKKLVFFNNKGGVGKTTLAFNSAVKFAEKGYKTVIVDLDTQCNISKLALGEQFIENTSHGDENTIYGVLKWIITWWEDVNLKIPFIPIRENVSLLQGSLNLGLYEDLLATSFSSAAAGQPLGYFQTSAISRFLFEKGLDEQIDLFIIDSSPNLGLLNRAILLGTDYFCTPLMPDAFSLQGIQNLWTTLEKRKKHRQNTAKVMAQTQNIPINRVLNGEGLFIGYIVNSYNQYAQQPIKSHRERIEKIPESVKEYLSEKHSKNWLVEQSRKKSLMDIKDYGELPTDGQAKNKAIFELIPWKDFKTVPWTMENVELAKVQFEELVDNIIDILEKY